MTFILFNFFFAVDVSLFEYNFIMQNIIEFTFFNEHKNIVKVLLKIQQNTFNILNGSNKNLMISTVGNFVKSYFYVVEFIYKVSF